MTTAEQSAADVAWDLDPLLDGRSVDELLDDAERRAVTLSEEHGRIAGYDVAELVTFMSELSTLRSLVGRAESYASLRFASDTSNPEHGALLQKVEERSTAIGTNVLFFDLEWAAVDDARHLPGAAGHRGELPDPAGGVRAHLILVLPLSRS